jgi:hypothetical protein
MSTTDQAILGSTRLATATTTASETTRAQILVAATTGSDSTPHPALLRTTRLTQFQSPLRKLP